MRSCWAVVLLGLCMRVCWINVRWRSRRCMRLLLLMLVMGALLRVSFGGRYADIWPFMALEVFLAFMALRVVVLGLMPI